MNKKAIIQLPCGCWFGKDGRQQKERWTFCTVALNLWEEYQRTKNNEINQQYQQHFKRKT